MRIYTVESANVKTSATPNTGVNALALTSGTNCSFLLYRLEADLWDAPNSMDGQLRADIYSIKTTFVAGVNSVTPQPLDLYGSAAAAQATCVYTPTTVTLNNLLKSVIFNQRGHGLWIAEGPGKEIDVPAGGGVGGTIVVVLTELTISAQQTINLQLSFAE